MAYILKNTSGLINTRITDTGRLKMSQGNFNISYFQIGDSEVSYNTLPSSYNQYDTHILEPNFNSQNSAGVPNSNKQNVKYPYYVDGSAGNTYGIPFLDSVISPIFNAASPRGFFTATTLNNTTYWRLQTNSYYNINSNYVVRMSTLNGTNKINLIYNECNFSVVRLPAVGDLVTIYYDAKGLDNCYCDSQPTPTPTPSPSTSPNSTPTPTPTPSNQNPCDPLPTPTPSKSAAPNPSPTPAYLPPDPPVCGFDFESCYSILTYKVVSICLNELTLDRLTPDFSFTSSNCYGRVIIYPPDMKSLYDSVTPRPHWSDNVINYDSVCGADVFDVKVWNMNIPWSENPAGLIDTAYEDYTYFGSIQYLGTKEFFGYASSSGQTDSSSVYYYNSFDEKVIVTPEEQKAIAIIHYTNQTIDLFYGEKFALQPFDPLNTDNTLGQARNFKLSLPWLMWHKSNDCCHGVTFYVDPPNFDELELFQVHYLKSTKNEDMNYPGIRYYHLWDTFPNDNGYPNRVGKVFPDQKIIVIDDEEIIAAMSYKSNRNWTLPAPKVSLVTPNICGNDNNSLNGILTGDTQYMYVTYRLSNTELFTNSLHCNYYTKIQGPNIVCNPISSQNVAVRFGAEFNCLNPIGSNPTTTTTTNFTTTTTTTFTTTTTTLCPPVLINGYFANKFEIICQKVNGSGRPESAEWKIIDFTSQLSGLTNGYITQDSLTGSTFVITENLYNSAPFYDLNDYIQLTPLNYSATSLNFGDEYYFYGNIETDIQATIYEMRYLINLGQSEFQFPSNPTWSSSKSSYVSEIGLYDSDKNLIVISKLQSPVLRQGVQQFLVKFDF